MTWDWLSALIGFGSGATLLSLCVNTLLKRTIDNAVNKQFAKAIERERARGRQAVDQENAAHRASLDISNQLRIAGIDRRLAAHQEAFALWRKLFKSMHTDEVQQVVLECQEWWEKNCLYLEPSVSDDFSRAYADAGMHESLLKSSRFNRNSSQVEENWQRVLKPGTSIPKAVCLPTIADGLEVGKNATGNVPE